MPTYSSRQAAMKLGIGAPVLSKYINKGRIAPPKSITTGGIRVYLWTEADIERVRKLLPKIANGRKTRYQKQKSEAGSQKSVKAKPRTKQPQAKRPVKK